MFTVVTALAALITAMFVTSVVAAVTQLRKEDAALRACAPRDGIS